MPMYQECRVHLGFVTPAFLGGAEGGAELRTPPFKSLLRRWWRVAHVQGQRPDVARMRELEGRLFGHAWLREGHEGQVWACQSQVRVRLDQWTRGNLTSWDPADPQVTHPEVGEGGRNVGAHLYLGFGPLVFSFRSGRTSLRDASALSAGTPVELTIISKPEVAPELHLDEITRLWKWFGTIGGRSRNGWGSFDVKADGLSAALDLDALRPFSRDFAACFSEDWPHAIGRDRRGLLLWRTRDCGSWSEAVRTLAETKIDFRTHLGFSWSAAGSQVGPRHVLAYPVTNHGVEAWNHGGDESFRLANQLLFKVVEVVEGSTTRYRGLVVHFPHRLPEVMLERLNPHVRKAVREGEQGAWQTVHRRLDEQMMRWD